MFKLSAAGKPLEEGLVHGKLLLVIPAGKVTGFCPNMAEDTGEVANLVELGGTQAGPCTSRSSQAATSISEHLHHQPQMERLAASCHCEALAELGWTSGSFWTGGQHPTSTFELFSAER